jgi:thiol-disulfide isomerase/thioredoxin
MRYSFTAATRSVLLAILLTVFNIMVAMAEQEDYRRPDFSLPDLDGVERSISEWDGKALIINFWASWCIPCLREIPLLNQLSAEYADKDLQIVGIAVDSPENVRKFLQNTSMDYLTLVEEKRSIEVANAFSNSYLMLPFTVYLDHAGRILWMQVEEVHREQIEPVLDQIWKIRSGESTYEQAQDELLQYFGGMNLE